MGRSTNNPTPAEYDARCLKLEAEGMTRSDAQAVLDVEIAKEQRDLDAKEGNHA